MPESKPVIDYAYRPSSYFGPVTPGTGGIAAIKGERRRNALRAAYDASVVTPEVRHYASPVLAEHDRRALGALHPSLMGGEYLPDRLETEVEIARINIESTTSDVVSIYAKPGKDRIFYRVVDEYEGDTLSDKSTRTSKCPLTLKQLVAFLLRAWSLREVLEVNDLGLDEAQSFTRPSSEFYPQFAAAIRAEISAWYDEIGAADEEGDG